MASKPLRNNRWESFAQLVATGTTPAQAYVSAGFSRNGARAGSFRLRQNVAIAQRIDALKTRIADAVTTRAVAEESQTVVKWIHDRTARVQKLERVADILRARIELEQLDPDAQIVREFRATLQQAAQELGQWSDKSETTWTFDGDFGKLSPAAQAKMIEQLERVAFGGDQMRLETARAEAVDVECRTVDDGVTAVPLP